MNKIFKLKHGSNGTKVVSEIARNSSKATDKRSKFASFALATALLSPLAVSPAFAANPNGTIHPDTQIGSSDGAANTNTVTGSADTVWGTLNTVSNNSTAFGQSNTATGDKSTAFGNSNKALGNQSTAFGVDNRATGSNSTAFGEENLAGYIGTDAASLEQMGITTVADFCKAIGAPTAVWCTKNTTLEAALEASIGMQVKNEAELATLLGVGGVSGAKNATAWGLNNLAGNKQATAFGEKSIANGVNSTAFGKDSYAYADNSLAALGGQVGLDSQGANNTAHSTTGVNSVAIGEKAWVRSDNAFALGKEALVEKDSDYAIAFGQQAKSYATNNISIGSEAKTGKSKAGTNNIAIGTKANANNAADKINGIAIGHSASANEENAFAIGFNAQTTLKDSVALGSNTTTKAGVKVKDTSVGGIKFETFAGELVNTNEVVSVGGGDVGTRQIQNVASGQVSETSTDAINGSQLYAAYDQLQWQVGTNGSSLGTVGKLSANNDKSNVNFIAGDGIEIIGQNINNGYGIKYNVKVDNDTIKIDSNGNLYADIKNTGGGSGGNNTQAKLTVNNGNEVSVSTPKTSGNIILEGKNLNTNKPIYDVSLNKDVKLDKGSITITGGKTVSISGDKVDMGGNRIQNVAPGVKPTDAVNVSQLKQSLGDIHNHINEAEDRTNAGISGAMAMAGLPQPIMPGKGMLSAAAGYYEEEGALAIGLSKVSDNGKWVLKTSASINTESKVGANVGIGFQW